ncbi:uncharacterized protein FTJAE_12898 [Fusarium tjaetaba]|uniref:DUF7908 domain-containing protein n=1 Tax=Fusarium tjaetaba TaxID=1567544 RepID=A0A8H5QIX8_9HYPO|nr:uncharacterized protein FTJAE_12898 [Fusarium tjaetaba]KAF5616751.1 hypothetical protein FTJAE_12898 [Fusarium tjaetaba]
MKGNTFTATLLGSAGIASAAEYPSMVMDTFCITYLSTYLAPISAVPELSPSRHLTFFGNGSTATAIASNTNDQGIISSEPGTTFGFTTLDIAPTDTQTDSEAPSSGATPGSLTEPIDSTSLPTTDITSSALATSTGIVEPPVRSVIFLVQAPSNQKRDIEKRDLGGFVGADNPDVCTFALTFSLGGGQLFIDGLPTFYAGEDYKTLGIQDEDSFVQGAITKTFGTSGQTLFFRNPGLPNGEAGFCQDTSGQVYMTFTASPPGCIPVTLRVYDVIQCQNGRLLGFDTSTSALAIPTETSAAETAETSIPEISTSTPETPSSGISSTQETTTAEATVTTEFNPPSSAEPSSSPPKTSSSEAFTAASPQNVDTSAFASSPLFGSVSSTISYQTDETSTPASSSVTNTGAISTVSSQAISSSTSTFGFGASTIGSETVDTSTSQTETQTETKTQTFGVVSSTIISSEFIKSSTTIESSILSSDSSTEVSSSTEQDESSLLATTSNKPTDTTSATFGSTSETPSQETSSQETSSQETLSEPASSASSDTSTSAEETTTDSSTTSLESSTEIITTTAEGSTTTTELVTTTTTAAPQSECEAASSPYTEQGVNFDLSCNTVITGGSSVGTAPASSFNQCIYFCAVYSSCVAVQYERATGSCTGFSSMTGTSANNDYDAAIRA